MANYKLVVDKGPQEGKSYPLASRVITVGRDPMVDIVIGDPEISRQHARFMREETGYTVQDLGSTNGTFVDGERLRGEAVALSPGQVISMGSNVRLFYEEDSEPMATVISPEAEIELPRREEAAPERRVSVYDSGAPAESDFDNVTAVKFPLAEEPEELPSFDDVEEEPGARETYQEKDYEAEDDALPSFEEPTPVYSPEPAGVGPPPPPLGAPPPPKNNRNRNIIIAAAVLLLLLCCCCLFLWAAWTYGDAFLNELQQLERFSHFLGTVPLGR